MKFILKILLFAAIAFGLTHFLPGIQLLTFWDALKFTIVLGLLNTFLKPLLQLIGLPITILTLGLFLLVINTGIVILADHLVSGAEIDGFLSAFIFSVVYSIITSLVNSFFNKSNG